MCSGTASLPTGLLLSALGGSCRHRPAALDFFLALGWTHATPDARFLVLGNRVVEAFLDDGAFGAHVLGALRRVRALRMEHVWVDLAAQCRTHP